MNAELHSRIKHFRMRRARRVGGGCGLPERLRDMIVPNKVVLIPQTPESIWGLLLDVGINS
jgi:hypothetical protein